MVAHRHPLLAYMRVFRAENLARRVLVMRGKNFVFTIILTDHVEHIREAVIVVVAGIGTEQSLRHGPGRVGGVGHRNEVGKNSPGLVRLRRVMDFVADAVNDDARMIAIAQNGVALVHLRPVIEIEMVVVLVFPHRPTIEKFVHDEQAQAVA